MIHAANFVHRLMWAVLEILWPFAYGSGFVIGAWALTVPFWVPWYCLRRFLWPYPRQAGRRPADGILGLMAIVSIAIITCTLVWRFFHGWLGEECSFGIQACALPDHGPWTDLARYVLDMLEAPLEFSYVSAIFLSFLFGGPVLGLIFAGPLHIGFWVCFLLRRSGRI